MTAAPPSTPLRSWPGYATPAATYPAPPERHTSHTRMFILLGVGLLVVIAIVVTVSIFVTPSPVHYKCPPYCGRPPVRPPVGSPPQPGGAGQPAGGVPPVGPFVQSFPRFTANDGAFSVAYDPDVAITREPGGVAWSYHDSHDELVGTVKLIGRAAGNQTAREIVENLIQDNYPGATLAYELPNAMVGYQPGYGEIDDYIPQGSSGTATRVRVVAIAAVKNGFALIAGAVGTYEKFTPGTTGQASGANTIVAELIGNYVNSFTWRGDPPR